MINSVYKYITGIVKLRGSDNTIIGNVADAIKTKIVSSSSDPVVTDFPLDHHDAFDKFRISEPTTLAEYQHRHNDMGELWSESLINGATAVYDANRVSMEIRTGITNGAKAVRQTIRHHHYHKGKGQLVYFTGSFVSLNANVRKRIGYFDDGNGVFFETNGTNIRLVVRSKISGSVVDTAINQADWNYDKLDGTGVSGLTLDITKQQLFVIDFTWLGSGHVRWGINIENKVRYIHSADFSNNSTTPYSQTGSLPIRYEIENLTAQATSDSLFFTCGSVISEGGIADNVGLIRSVDTGVSAVSLSAVEKVVFGIRINSAHKNASILPLTSEISNLGTSDLYWKIVYNPVLTGATWSAITGIAEGLTNNPTYTGGIIMDSGYIPSSGKGALNSMSLIQDKFLGYLLDGTTTPIVIVIRTITGNSSCYFSGSYAELQ